MRNSLPTILLVALIATTPFLAATEPPEDGRYAAIFPPGWQARDILLASAARDHSPVTFGRTGNIGIFDLPLPSDRDALRAAGAWLILPADAFRGCLTAPAFAGSIRQPNPESPA
ncbi:hypothetical protein [Maricaulis sp.]|uniref:hypothetical protein n=1 Tax=Maricaulis sp. TaxID=1486257 RepID=UPI0025BC3B8B|nr:hypothetical protein [Maricaulis sp.]